MGGRTRRYESTYQSTPAPRIRRLVPVDQSNTPNELPRRLAITSKGDEDDVETSTYSSFGFANYPGIRLIIRVGNH